MKFDLGFRRGEVELNGVATGSRSFAGLRSLSVRHFAMCHPSVGPSVDPLVDGSESAPFKFDTTIYSDLRAVIRITRAEMARLNSLSRVIPPDSVSKMVELLTRPSTMVALLYKNESSRESGRTRRVVGFARLFQDLKDFPDREAIPPELLGEEVVRFDRFFVLDEGRVFDARGGAASDLFDQVVALANGKRILAKVLVGPGTVHPGWLIAKRALEDRNFEDTGHSSDFEHFTHADGQTTVAEFRWYVYPPITANGMARQEASSIRFEELSRPVRRRLAPVVGNLSLDGSLVVCYSMEPDPWDLAKLYPRNFVVGIGSNAENRWRDERLPNLRVIKEDLLQQVVPSNTAAATTCFGVLPDLAVKEGGSALENLLTFLSIQHAQLAPGGRLILRDTYDPVVHHHKVCMHLQSSGVRAGEESYLGRFNRFLEVTRAGSFLTNEAGVTTPIDFEFDRAGDSVERYQTFVGDYSIGNEFRLKAPYRKDLERESRRFYTAYSLEQILNAVEESGFRVISAQPEFSDYTLRHQLQGEIKFTTVEGSKLPPLPTHIRVVAEKIDPTLPVAIVAEGEGEEVRRGSFLEVLVCERLEASWGRKVGERRSLVHRPNLTLTPLPYYRTDDDILLFARVGFPRPLVLESGELPDGSIHSPFLTEEVSLIVKPEELESEEDRRRTLLKFLKSRLRVNPDEVVQFETSNWYLPSADITDEKIVWIPIEIKVPKGRAGLDSKGISGFSTDGVLRLVSGRQLLQGCHDGGVRLQNAAYNLFREKGISLGPAAQPLELAEIAEPLKNTISARSVLTQSGPPHFQIRPAEQDTFFTVYRNSYVEQFSDGRRGASVYRDCARPTEVSGYSGHLIALLPLVQQGGEVFVGIHTSPDMPASAVHGLGSKFPTVPQLFLPTKLTSIAEIEQFAAARLLALFGITIRQLTPLGDAYFASPGALPRIVFPYAAEVERVGDSPLELNFVPLQELLNEHRSIRCGQLLTLAYRAGHGSFRPRVR